MSVVVPPSHSTARSRSRRSMLEFPSRLGRAMPTVLRDGPYRFFFYMADRGEPAHVHVERDEATAKFWLEPVRLAYGGAFTAVELRHLERIVEENRYVLLEHWDEHFGV